MPKVRWVLLYRFCSEFNGLSGSAKILKIGYDLTKLQKV